MNLPRVACYLLTAAVLLLAGCETRSISNSDYRSGYYYPYGAPQKDGYRGELSEFDVLGVDATTSVTDADIAKALQTVGTVRLKRTGKVLLIQSGADFPDAPMQEAMSRVFAIGPFSGKPSEKSDPA